MHTLVFLDFPTWLGTFNFMFENNFDLGSPTPLVSTTGGCEDHLCPKSQHPRPPPKKASQLLKEARSAKDGLEGYDLQEAGGKHCERVPFPLQKAVFLAHFPYSSYSSAHSCSLRP